jgi:hypothetical protein
VGSLDALERLGRERPFADPPRLHWNSETDVVAASRRRAPPAPAETGSIGFDVRVELLGLLKTALTKAEVPAFLRSGSPELAGYVEEAVGRFGPRIDSGLLESIEALAASSGNSSFPWYGVTQMMMDVTPAPGLAVLSPAWRAGPALHFLDRLRRFSEESRFPEFVESFATGFDQRLAPVRRVVSSEAYGRAVAGYIGADARSFYDVIFSPLLRGVALEAIIKRDDGSRGARSILCPLNSADELRHALVAPREDDLLWRGWHETLHLSIDRWCELHESDVERLRPLYDRIGRLARRKSWLDCLSEHLVRATTQRMLLQRRGQAAWRELAEADRRFDYAFVDALVERLDGYERARSRYATLLDFFPEWLEALPKP